MTAALKKRKRLFESPGTGSSAGNAELYPSAAGGPAAAAGALREVNRHKAEQKGGFLKSNVDASG